jgi:drug/metabolite transporter (DMT)-like permease
VEAVAGRRPLLGALFVLLGSATFGTSGAFAKPLIASGWSPLVVVTLRVSLSALVMVPVALWSLRGRMHLLRHNLRVVLAYGAMAVAGAQLFYFNAVQLLSVGVALLLEYLGVILVVGWLWVRYGRRPSLLTALGIVCAVAGLVLVLDVLSGLRVSGAGVVWGLLAAVGLAVFYVVSSHEDDRALPPLALAGLGLGAGAVVLLVACLLRVLPVTTGARQVDVAGHAVAWWLPVLELALVAATAAYAFAVVGARLAGATLASFLGLSEVLFAVLAAWLVLGEMPRLVQLGGGVLVLAGVVLVRLAEIRAARASLRAALSSEPETPVPVL